MKVWKLWLKDEKECKFWLDSYTRKRILKKVSDESRLHIKRTDHNLTFANWIIEKHKDEIPEVFGGDNFYDWVMLNYQKDIIHFSLRNQSNYFFRI